MHDRNCFLKAAHFIGAPFYRLEYK